MISLQYLVKFTVALLRTEEFVVLVANMVKTVVAKIVKAISKRDERINGSTSVAVKAKSEDSSSASN